MLRHTSRLCREHPGEAALFAVVTPGDRAAMCPVLDECGVSYRFRHNSPVSAKWQAGFSVVHHLAPACHGIMTVGSDDLMTAGYLDASLSRLSSATFGWGPADMYFYDASSRRIGHHDTGVAVSGIAVPYGAGRVYTRKALDMCDWKLWRVPRNRGLDCAASARLASVGAVFDVLPQEAPGSAVLDVKDGLSINRWDGASYTRLYKGNEAALWLEGAGLSGVVAEFHEAWEAGRGGRDKRGAGVA